MRSYCIVISVCMCLPVLFVVFFNPVLLFEVYCSNNLHGVCCVALISALSVFNTVFCVHDVY